jgi:hypothetical protein
MHFTEAPVARAIWTGALSFGLVNIPVEVHTAVRDSRPRFRMLHAKDKSPINFERVCQKEGQPVAWEDLVKGYEYEKGRFVVLTKEDFTAAALEKTRRIDILDFVRAKRSTTGSSTSRTTSRRGRAATPPTCCCARRSANRAGSASRSSSCATSSIWRRSRQ